MKGIDMKDLMARIPGRYVPIKDAEDESLRMRAIELGGLDPLFVQLGLTTQQAEALAAAIRSSKPKVRSVAAVFCRSKGLPDPVLYWAEYEPRKRGSIKALEA